MRKATLSLILGVTLLVSWVVFAERLIDFSSSSVVLNLVVLPVRLLALFIWPVAGIGAIWLGLKELGKPI